MLKLIKKVSLKTIQGCFTEVGFSINENNALEAIASSTDNVISNITRCLESYHFSPDVINLDALDTFYNILSTDEVGMSEITDLFPLSVGENNKSNSDSDKEEIERWYMSLGQDLGRCHSLAGIVLNSKDR